MDEWDVLRAQELVEDTEDARVVGMTLAFKTRLKSSLPSAPTKPSLRVPWNCRGQVLGGGGWGKISGASDTYSHPLQPSVFVCVCVREKEREIVCVTVGQTSQGGTQCLVLQPTVASLLMSGWESVEPVVSPSPRLVPPAAGRGLDLCCTPGVTWPGACQSRSPNPKVLPGREIVKEGPRVPQ